MKSCAIIFLIGIQPALERSIRVGKRVTELNLIMWISFSY